MKEILALVLWIEARGEPLAGKMGTASVMWTRGNGEPAAIVQLVTSVKWNGKYGLRLLASVKPDRGSKAWRDCVDIATSMCDGSFVPSFRANLVHATSIKKPTWKEATLVAKIGRQLFYYSPFVV